MGKPIYHNQIDYVYNCKGQEITLTDEETQVEHGQYFYAKCDKCCNVTVYHMLYRKVEKEVDKSSQFDYNEELKFQKTMGEN